MADEQPEPAESDIHLSSEGNTNIGGDIVGRDKITSIYNVQQVPIETVQTILEHLHLLIETNSDPNRRLFDDHVEPIYQKLRGIVDDYSEILITLEQMLVDANAIGNIIQELTIRRQKFANIRKEMISYSELLESQHRQRDVDEFAQAAIRLLTLEPATSTEREAYFSSTLSSLIDDLRIAQKQGVSIDDIGLILRNYVREINQQYGEVVRFYLNLRVSCLR